MNTSTKRPVQQDARQRGKASQQRRHSRQTAHIEARRDGKPLIFGWGKHLSHTEKVRIQRRATWGMAAFIILLLLVVIVGAWINVNIIVPGLTLSNVNGHVISQGQYRKMVAVKTQIELNKLYGTNGLTNQVTNLQKQDAVQSNTISSLNTQIANLNKQIKALPAGPSAQRTTLTSQLNAAQKQLTAAQQQHTTLQGQITNLQQNTLPLEKQTFTQSQIGNDSATWLQDDELLREWLTSQKPAIQQQINPGTSQVNKAFNDLKANTPKTGVYNTFLGQMGISDSDIRDMLTILARRDNAQKYFAALITSPSYQVLAREITLPTQLKANQVMQNLQKGQDFATLARTQSQDTNTNTKGGSMDWVTRYQYFDNSAGGIGGPAQVDNWLFDPARKLNETSPILFGNGAYYIVQIMNIDPSRTITDANLKALKANALVDWLLSQRALTGQHITPSDQNMMFDPANLPDTGVLPSGAPGINPNGGVPGAPGTGQP